MADTTENLATLIGSRICHDLISPIGAINNGLELLDITGVTSGPEMELIADSVGNAGARIRFFRIAYGAAGDQLLGASEIASVLKDLARGSKVKVEWTPPGDHSRRAVRLAFLAIQCCETALPYGGNIQVSEGDGHWQILGTGQKVALDETLWTRLSQPSAGPDVTPASVQFALLPMFAAEQQRRVRVVSTPDTVKISF